MEAGVGMATRKAETLRQSASAGVVSGSSSAGATLIGRLWAAAGAERSHWDISAVVAADDNLALQVEDEDRGRRHRKRGTSFAALAKDSQPP